MRRRFVDLSHAVLDGHTAYPGLPAPQIRDHLGWDDSHHHYAEGTEFRIGHISMVGNTGTYLDTPAHRYRDGYDLAALPLDLVADVPGVRVATSGQRIGPELLAGIDVAGRAVLFDTGWSQYWGTDRYASPDHPYLSDEAAELLAALGAAVVGIDSVNIDDTSTVAVGTRPAHSTLLRSGIPIVEHLCNLSNVTEPQFTFSAVPVRVRDFGTFPVRAYAQLTQA